MTNCFPRQCLVMCEAERPAPTSPQVSHATRDADQHPTSMSRLLYVESSPRKTLSVSMEAAHVFLHTYAALHPTDELDTLDLWAESLPEFDQAAIGSKYKSVSGEELESAEAATWQQILALIERIQQADKLIFGVPMWNFAIPYKLKHFIDLVTQRGHLFSFDGKTYGPLLRDKKALVIYTRGSDYGPGSPSPLARYDHQQNYFDFWLRFIGVTDITEIAIENTWGDHEREARRFARGEAASAAQSF